MKYFIMEKELIRNILITLIAIGILVSITTGCEEQGNPSKSNNEITSQYSSLNNNATGKSTNESHDQRSETVKSKDIDKMLKGRVENEGSQQKQLQILFDALYRDSPDQPLMSHRLDILAYTMNKLYNFLNTDEAYNMADEEYPDKFYGVHIFPLKEGRIVSYCGRPSIFGESSGTMWAFYQKKSGKDIVTYKLYEESENSLWYAALLPSNNSYSIISVAGNVRVHPSAAFVDGFKIYSDKIEYISILNEYKDDHWIINTTGQVRCNSDEFLGCQINSFSDSLISIGQVGENGSDNLNLRYDSSESKYKIEK